MRKTDATKWLIGAAGAVWALQVVLADIDRANAEADRKAQAEADDLGNARRLLKLRRRMRARRGGGADGLVDAA